ncbi:MAG TPA: phospho-sugar mutase [Chthoniobacterales bacterium]|nr:phospho-sugar mutase [Chthoniobacterales bacterium]
MSTDGGTRESSIDAAVASGQLLESAAANIRTLLSGAPSDIYSRAVDELIESAAWSELNDRFFKTLAFGTGGLRGRTIGKIVTAAEQGRSEPGSPPEFPCVGTNAMNFYNINRATRGLVAYLKKWLGQTQVPAIPKLVIAHDTRFFSREFADLAAKIAAQNGCDAFVFEGPRSTPELSFAVRQLEASAGIVITASHNPPHDNGYKVYFSDGAQVVEPHASGIIAEVNSIKGEGFTPLPPNDQGRVTTIGADIDHAYMNRLETLILDPKIISAAKSLRVVFTPIHGTGGIITKPMLNRLGLQFEVVPEQDQFDGAFPTVKSPNPENAEALKMAIDMANRTNADLVIATDPDCDRMGVAVRNQSGQMELLTGNQIGSLMAYYRTHKLFELGILNKENADRGAIIKTFVTTDLQKAIAEHFGVRCVETLTGFKYIGQKLGKYENALPADVRSNYRQLSEEQTRKLRLQHSSFYVFGGEESYGYSGADFVRDKDGNGAVIMFCEAAAFAKAQRQTVDQLLDEIYCRFGYFEEKNGSLVFEGAEGAGKISRLAQSYATAPPNEMLETKVVSLRNFEKEAIYDVEGDLIPKEKMSIFELEDRTRIAVRPSGTEPKIKYYLFAQRRPEGGKFDLAELERTKTDVRARLEKLWDWLQTDAERRLGN